MYNFFLKNGNLIIGGAIIFILVFIAIFAPFLSPYNPYDIALEHTMASPSSSNWLGRDKNGSDILSILIYGCRLSLEVGVTATFFSVLIGLILGSTSGYIGGRFDQFMMRFLDMIFAFPGIILAIAISTVMGASKFNVIFALIMTGWAGYTRLVRGEVLALKEKEFIQAAQALGLSPIRIVVRHLWPNLVSPIVIAASFGLAGTILAEASLSFLGIGVPPGTPSWGALINMGRDVLMDAPHVASFPGLAIMITILGFNFLGEGLREKLDPKA